MNQFAVVNAIIGAGLRGGIGAHPLRQGYGGQGADATGAIVKELEESRFSKG